MLSSSKQNIVHSLIRWPLSFALLIFIILVLQKILYCLHMQIDLQTVCKHFFKINIWMLELLRLTLVNQLNILLIKCSCCINCSRFVQGFMHIAWARLCCPHFFNSRMTSRMSNLLSPSNTRTRKWVKSFLLNSFLLTEKLNQFYSVMQSST